MEKEAIQQQSYSESSMEQASRRSLTSRVEQLPSDAFLVGAACSVGLSLLLRLTGRQHDALFVGQWAPTLLLVGLYAKGAAVGREEQGALQHGAAASAKEMH